MDDFFRKNKSDCLLLLSFFGLTLFYHSFLENWHGLVSWGPRYLLLTIPFLLIPLGASLEKRNKLFMLIIIISLSLLGVFFNISYVIQDVSWFVWSSPGSTQGLYSLGNDGSAYYFNDYVIWTFQYSQLTHSISLMMDGLNHDIYLLHLLGSVTYTILLLPLLSFLFFIFWGIAKNTIIQK